MRFSELNLLKYGQFDGCTFSFPKAASDLQILVGPNEAGKSTSMSAIADLLFGFPHTAAYDFQFDKVLLRVGGRIESAGAGFCYRRKRGNTRTLLNDQEEPVDEAPLVALLAGQTRESFLRSFSLDHGRLRAGGRAILEAKDDVGQAIFAAGSGLLGVTKVADALDEEAKEIWTERTSASRSYYKANAAWQDARDRLKAGQVKTSQWTELKKALDALETDLSDLSARQLRHTAATQLVERKRRVLSPLAQHLHLHTRLQELGPLPELPANAGEVLETALTSIATAETEARLAQAQKAAAELELADLTFDGEILKRRDELTRLRAEKGAADKALRDTPSLQVKAQSGRAEIDRLLMEIGWPPSPLEELQRKLPGRPLVAELRDLADVRRTLETRMISANEDRLTASRAEVEYKVAVAELASSAGPTSVSATLRAIRGYGDLEATQKAARSRAERSQRQLQDSLRGLAPWVGDASTLRTLELPSAERAEALGKSLVEAREALADAERQHIELTSEMARRDLERSQLVHDELAVTSTELSQARHDRDATLAALAGQIGQQAAVVQSVAAAGRLSLEIREADALADRRFLAAETSARLLAIEHEIERLNLLLSQGEEEVARRIGAVAQALTAWRAATSALDCEILPLELAPWTAKRTRVIQLAEEVEADGAEARRLDALVAAIKTDLLAHLPPDDRAKLSEASFAKLFAVIESVEAEETRIHEARVVAETKLTASVDAVRAAAARIATIESQLEDWNGRWLKALASASLTTDASPTLVQKRLDLMDDLRAAVDKTRGFEQRIADIKVDVESFTERVRSAAAECGIATDEDVGQLLVGLERALQTASELFERERGVRRRISDASGRESKAAAAISEARSRLSPVYSAAGVEDDLELRRLIRSAGESRDLRAQLGELEKAILGMGDGLPFDTLLREVEGAEPDVLVTESEALKEEARELLNEMQRVSALHQVAKLRFKEADERPDGAIAAADMAQARAEMEIQAEAYLRKRTQAMLLRWGIDRYRKEKQAPLLKRASAIFAELTLGRYVALEVDIEDGKPRLSGLRSDGATVVPVIGMSEGTIDQLFLSLRLAGVEESVDAGHRLPFLADDLFINYDDERSAAGFRVLSRLAEKTQVLFFTHHSHLIDVARSALHPAQVAVCEVGEQVSKAA